MWYVIQVYSGKEEYCKNLIEKYVCSGIFDDCKIPVYIKLRKRGEIWNQETKILFPGYIFVKTENIVELHNQLKFVPHMTRLLGTGKDIIPISKEEEILLAKLGKDEMIIDISKGIIVNGKVLVLSGPLQGMEGYIKKVNRHKKLAWVDISMLGRKIQVPMGLEILQVVEKI